MTVSSEISRNDRVGNGVLDTFIFEFEIYAKTDILVYVGGILKTVDTHYTVPVAGINNAAGGTIVFTGGNIPILNAEVAIILDLPLTQLIDYVEGDKFPAETHEMALDRIIKIAQSFKEASKRVLKVIGTSTLDDIIVPIAAGEFLQWNDDADAIVTVPPWTSGDPLPDHHDHHENGGADEISVTGLSGLLPDDQHVLDAEVLAVAEDKTKKGVASGYASLDADTKVPIAQIPTQLLQNLLPNCQWQLWTSGYITKQNVQGTGNQAAVSCTGFDITNNNPLFYTTNTQVLRNGDLVIISGGGFQWSYAGVGPIDTLTAVRVINLVANTSFQVVAPLGGVTPGVSVAVTATPISAGIFGVTGTGQAADGWKKTTTMTVIWADDFAANACPGAIRTMGIRKDLATAEDLYWICASNQIAKYQGQVITFGVLVYQKVQTGAGTWRLWIYDDIDGKRYSTAGTGKSYSDPTYNGFEFLSVTATINPGATQFNVGIEFDGAISDVYYCALPMMIFGSSLVRSQCRQNVSEMIRPIGHWNPPLLTPLAMDFPATEHDPASGLYGFSSQDLEAMSLGVIHKSVAMVMAKIEFHCGTVGAQLFIASSMDYSMIFGPQASTNVVGVCAIGQAWLPLSDDGTFAIFTGTDTLTITNATFDFDLVQLSMPLSEN